MDELFRQLRYGLRYMLEDDPGQEQPGRSFPPRPQGNHAACPWCQCEFPPTSVSDAWPPEQLKMEFDSLRKCTNPTDEGTDAQMRQNAIDKCAAIIVLEVRTKTAHK